MLHRTTHQFALLYYVYKISPNMHPRKYHMSGLGGMEVGGYLRGRLVNIFNVELHEQIPDQKALLHRDIFGQ